MALTIEDGTGVPNADSFVTLAEVRAFAAARGKGVSENDEVLEGQIRSAHDYLVAREQRLQGQRTNEEQTLPFPRSGVTLYGRTVEDNVIPTTLKNAICMLVIENQTTEDLMPTGDGKVVVSEAVGPISTTYAVSGTASAQPVFPKVDAYLQPLYLNSFGGLAAVRV